MSHRSRFGYEPPISRRDYAQILSTLADMARESDALAQIATSLVGRVNLYGTRSQVCAALYEAAAEAVSKNYRDVISLASPEPPRESDARRPYALAEVALVAMYLTAATRGMTSSVSSIGWTLARIVDDCGLTWKRDRLDV